MGNVLNIDPKKIIIDIAGDRPREFKLGHKGYSFLAQKYGSVKKAVDLYQESCSAGFEGMTFEALDAIADFCYAGLLSDATRAGEKLERGHVVDLLDVDFFGFIKQMSGGVTDSLPEAAPDADPTSAPA